MPPKKVSFLTEPEQMLLLIASRIDTAIRHKEANPGEDYSHYLGNLSEEVKYIKDIYKRFPQSPGTHHRVHASVAIVGQEWQVASRANRTPDIDQITVKAINKVCENTAGSYPEWPSILWSDNLSKHAAEQPEESQWWLPAYASDESDDAAPRRSGRINKGKAPAFPTADIIGHAPTRGQKRTAAADRPEEIDDSSEPTPRKANNPPTFNVVIESPPSTRAKQRIRTNEAGDAVDVPDVSESASELPWVGRGKDRCTRCVDLDKKICVPQWAATKHFKACKNCATLRKTCAPPPSWLKMVELHRSEMGKTVRKDAPSPMEIDDDPGAGVAAPRRRIPRATHGTPTMAALDARLLTVEVRVASMQEQLQEIRDDQKKGNAMLLAICNSIGIKPVFPTPPAHFAAYVPLSQSIPIASSAPLVLSATPAPLTPPAMLPPSAPFPLPAHSPLSTPSALSALSASSTLPVSSAPSTLSALSASSAPSTSFAPFAPSIPSTPSAPSASTSLLTTSSAGNSPLDSPVADLRGLNLQGASAPSSAASSSVVRARPTGGSGDGSAHGSRPASRASSKGMGSAASPAT